MKWKLYIWSLLLLISCKADYVNVVLPAYEGQLMVECYLEPGKHYKLLLSESVAFLDSQIVKPINNAEVRIKYAGKTINLTFNTNLLDPDDSLRAVNYVHPTALVPEDYDGEFQLIITDVQNRVVTAYTHIARQPALDSMVYSQEAGKAYVTSYIKVNPSTISYYRFLAFHPKQADSRNQNTEATDDPNDINPFAYVKDNQLIITSKKDFFSLDPAKPAVHEVQLYNINKDYYEFLVSVKNAQAALGNPFAQPASIRSNVIGGVGIFTGFKPYTRIINSPQ